MEVRNQNNNSELGKTFRERKKNHFKGLGERITLDFPATTLMARSYGAIPLS